MSETASPADADLAFSSLQRQAAMVRAGARTPRALVDAALERIAALDPQLHAFARVRPEAARAEADAAARRLAEGDGAPLLGVPVAVKDDMDLDGAPATHGCNATGQTPPVAGDVVGRLRAAGAIVVGQTAMAPLALYAHDSTPAGGPPVRNPHALDRTPGGSSGGSAAAVAAGLVAAAVGTDGGGSIRVPAAACGLVGFKPQHGRVPLAPADHWHGLTHAGPLARSVGDAALLLDALAPREDGGSWVADAGRAPGRLRVRVVVRGALPARLGDEQRAAVQAAAAALRELGHDVEDTDVRWPDLRAQILPRYLHGARVDAQRLGVDVRRLPRAARGLVRLGGPLGRLLPRAQRGHAATVARVQDAIFAGADVVLTPTVAQAPPRIGHLARAGALRTFNGMTPWVAYTSPWNLTGQPALALPAGRDRDGLPRSVQLVGRPDADGLVLALGQQLEGVLA
jgi:amidase